VYRIELIKSYLKHAAQTFQWNIRSSTFTKDTLVFAVAPPAVTSNASALLTSVLDPTFAFSGYKQQTYTIPSGIYANYHVLSISFQARRISTMSSIFLIFPLCLVCLALVLVLKQEPAKDNRLTVPASGITATMYFSFVVSNMCPPVSYLTRMHLLIFQTYIFAIAELCFNYYLWRIQAARKVLADNNASNKNVLNDAHWMPRKILPPPTNAVVQPDGVYKPQEMKVLETKTDEIFQIVKIGETESDVAPSDNGSEIQAGRGIPARVALSASEAPPSSGQSARIMFTHPPPAAAPYFKFEPLSYSRWDMPPSRSPSPFPNLSGQQRSVSADIVMVVDNSAGQPGKGVSLAAQGMGPVFTSGTRFGQDRERFGQDRGLGAFLKRLIGSIFPRRRAADPESAAVAGARFGGPKEGGPGAASVAAPEVKKQKSADTGAYVDKTGEFKDVMDLLDSAEVKTFKKLKWGSPDVFMFRGLLKVSVQATPSGRQPPASAGILLPNCARRICMRPVSWDDWGLLLPSLLLSSPAHLTSSSILHKARLDLTGSWPPI
jgi:hypothetical protein